MPIVCTVRHAPSMNWIIIIKTHLVIAHQYDYLSHLKLLLYSNLAKIPTGIGLKTVFLYIYKGHQTNPKICTMSH